MRHLRDWIRKESLERAKELAKVMAEARQRTEWEAAEIIAEAKRRAQQIINQAKKS